MKCPKGCTGHKEKCEECMKLPSDAVLKRAWMAGERTRMPVLPYLNNKWKYWKAIYIPQLRAIARVILQEQEKGKKGEVAR